MTTVRAFPHKLGHFCNFWKRAGKAFSLPPSSYAPGYVRLLVLHLLFILKPWLIVEMQPAEIFSVGPILDKI